LYSRCLVLSLIDTVVSGRLPASTRRILPQTGRVWGLFTFIMLAVLVMAATSAHAGCRGRPGPGVNYYDCDLSNADFDGANLVNANLSDADLFGADFIDADLTNANLTNAKLQRANLRGIKGLTVSKPNDLSVSVPAGSTGTKVSFSSTAKLGQNYDLSSLLVFDPTSNGTFPVGTTPVSVTLLSGFLLVNLSFNMTVALQNTGPTAGAGPDQTVSAGTQVTLDGTGSTDSDGTIASYAWIRTGGTGSAANAALSSAAASQPTFTDSSLTATDTAVTHIFSLVVTDDDGATSTADTVTITINPPNQPMELSGRILNGPLRIGGKITYEITMRNPNGVSVANVIALAALGDRNNQPSIGESPAGMSFSNPILSGACTGNLTQLPAPNTGGVASQSLTFPAGASCTATIEIAADANASSSIAGTYPAFGFAEFDTNAGSITTDVSLAPVVVDAATPSNVAPMANAGADQVVTTGAQVTLDGTGSSDSDGTIASYAWTRTGGTGTAASAVLNDATASQPTFTDSSLTSRDMAATHVFSLVVTDDDGTTSAVDTVTITINPSVDVSSPNVMISTSTTKHNGSTGFIATVTFDKPVKGFVDGELVATNATIGPLSPNTGTGSVFTAAISPRSPLDVVLSVAAGVAQDMGGNTNKAANEVTVKGTIIEHTQRVISSFMQSRAHHIFNSQQDLKGFITGDNLGGPGRLGNLAFRANRAQFDLAFATSRSKIFAAQQANTRISHAFRAAGGSQQTKAAQTALLEQTVSDTGHYGSGYVSADNTAKPVGAANTFDTPSGHQSVPTRTGTWDIWTEIYGSGAKTGSADSSLWLGYLGAHYFTAENHLVGVLGQLDWAEEKGAVATSSAEGLGWMVGPYVAGKVPGQDLFYEARIAYGQSDNKVSPIGTYSDDFTTQRWLAYASLSGQFKQDEYIITPQASIAWYRDKQQRYTDSLGNVIPQQTVELGEVRFGPSLSRGFELESGLVAEPEIGLTGAWSFGVGNNAAKEVLPGNNTLRARLDMGLALTSPEYGMSLSLKGHYDGIGVDNFQSYGGKLRLRMRLLH